MLLHHPACASTGSLRGCEGSREVPKAVPLLWCHLQVLKVLMGLKCISQILSELITPPAPQKGPVSAQATSPTWDSRVGTQGWQRDPGIGTEQSSAVLLGTG